MEVIGNAPDHQMESAGSSPHRSHRGGSRVLRSRQVNGAKVDNLPEFEPTIVEIQTEALGLSAAEVEQLITVPLEADLLAGVAWLDVIRSESSRGSRRSR